MQIRCALNGIKSKEAADMVIAYEPVWAIGTGSTASLRQCRSPMPWIWHELSLRLGDECAAEIRILYGGSVKPENVAPLLGVPDIR